jgi:hypothetical protein
MKRFNRLISVLILTILLILPASHSLAAGGIPVTEVSGGINTNMVVDDKIRTAPVPYGDMILKGVIPDHDGLVKFGANAAVSTSEEVIWTNSNGRTYLTAAETLNVRSTDVNDTAAGTGARTVTLSGQTTAFVEITETVTLNGTTSVATTNPFLRIYRVTVDTAGSSEINEGAINIYDNADTALLAQVAASRGQSQMAFWTVPAGKTAFVKQVFAGEGANKRVTVRLYARDNTVTDAAWQLKLEIEVNLAHFEQDFFIPLKFTEKTDLKLVAQSGITGGDVKAGFSLYYED